MKKGCCGFWGGRCCKSYHVNPFGLIAQAKGPIKIGYISPLSGGMAANGKDMLMALSFYLQEIGYQSGGSQDRTPGEDDEANPATGLTKTRKLVEKDGVHIMTAGINGLDSLCPCALYRLQEIP